MILSACPFIVPQQTVMSVRGLMYSTPCSDSSWMPSLLTLMLHLFMGTLQSWRVSFVTFPGSVGNLPSTTNSRMQREDLIFLLLPRRHRRAELFSRTTGLTVLARGTVESTRACPWFLCTHCGSENTTELQKHWSWSTITGVLRWSIKKPARSLGPYTRYLTLENYISSEKK